MIEIQDLAHKLPLMRVSLIASRYGALPAIPGILDAHDVFVLLSELSSLSTTLGLKEVDGAR